MSIRRSMSEPSESKVTSWARCSARVVAAERELLVEVLVLEQLEEPADREDRRAQLVRGGRDEPLAAAIQLGELLLHLVQRAPEPPELLLHAARASAPTAATAARSVVAAVVTLAGVLGIVVGVQAAGGAAAGYDAEKTIGARVWAMVEGGFASAHDALIANKVAHILCGGPVAAGALLPEQHFLDLEREAFRLKLIITEGSAQSSAALDAGKADLAVVRTDSA